MIMKKTTIKYNNFNNNNNNLNNNNQNISVLPVELNSILIGTMLGDGGLYRSSPTELLMLDLK